MLLRGLVIANKRCGGASKRPSGASKKPVDASERPVYVSNRPVYANNYICVHLGMAFHNYAHFPVLVLEFHVLIHGSRTIFSPSGQSYRMSYSVKLG